MTRHNGRKRQPNTIPQRADLDFDDGLNQHLVERFKGSRNCTQHTTVAAGPSAAKLDNKIQRYMERGQPSQATESWCRIPEIPSTQEVLQVVGAFHDSSLRDDIENERLDQERDFHLGVSEVNNVTSPWDSKEDYLKTHYKLLRADSLIQLRQAVTFVKEVPTACESAEFSNRGIYGNVFLSGITPTMRGIGVRVKFSLDRIAKKIDWKQSKRLMAGSLVVLLSTPDAALCKVAVVAARPITLLEQATGPEIDLFFACSEDLEIDCRKEWIMVEERSSFYESQRHTMVALQRMMDESFPLSEYLVELSPSVNPAPHVLAQPRRNISSIIPGAEHEVIVDVMNSWPQQDNDTTLDNSQMTALQRILSKSLALVQGPPGTGKTHVSVQALRIMLDKHKDGDPPIIIACQTNHALDQLLRHIEPYAQYIRLGSRSKDIEVKKRTMYETRRSETGQFPKSGLFRRACRTIESLAREISELLQPLQSGYRFLDPVMMIPLGILNENQVQSLNNNVREWITAGVGEDEKQDSNVFEIWLGKDQVEDVQRRGKTKIFDEIEEAQDIEELKETEAEQIAGDDDEDMLDMRFHTKLADTCDGKEGKEGKEGKDGKRKPSDATLSKLLREHSDIGSIPSKARGPLYRYLLRRFKAALLVRFRELAAKLMKAVSERKFGRWDEDHFILKQRKVIGVTTTGLAKYRALIASLEPKIVLIEEAAETLEAPIIAACVESIEQLILVGDHKQLRPQCHFKALENPPFNLNISLFERLVLNGVEFSCLSRQRRMIPQARRLLRPIYGNAIEDHPDVLSRVNRPLIPGMGTSPVWFLSHNWIEQRDDQRSYLNNLEAEMIVYFIRYLIVNGTNPEQITVLTFYHGQRRKLIALLKSLGVWTQMLEQGLKIATVDSYQGEENDIIILSLARNNYAGNIGFLGVDNRTCVALSRARRGLYVFGNADLLRNGSATWSQVITILEHAQSIGPALPVCCQKHRHITLLDQPADFLNNHGGCDERCGVTLICGHECPKKCHPDSHEQYRCRQRCGKGLPCGHECNKECTEICVCPKCRDHVNTTSSGDNQTSKLKLAFLTPSASAGSAGNDQTNRSSRSKAEHSRTSSHEEWQQYANGGVHRGDAALATTAKEKMLEALFSHNANSLFENHPDITIQPEPSVNFDASDSRQIWRTTHRLEEANHGVISETHGASLLD